MKNEVLESQLNTLGVLDKFIANTRKERLKDPELSLYFAFYWGDTEEGFKFWDNIVDKLNEYTTIATPKPRSISSEDFEVLATNTK